MMVPTVSIITSRSCWRKAKPLPHARSCWEASRRPREPAEIIGGDGEDVLGGKAQVIERSGRDVTAMYVEGAFETLRQAQAMKATLVVLKEYSPSCGSSMIYNGEFAGKAKAGLGVTAALLRRHGIEVISEEQFADWTLE